MATLQAWEDFNRLIGGSGLFSGCENTIQNFKIFYDALAEFKVEVLDDPERAAELTKLVNEHPDWTPASINNKINYYKTAYEWLDNNGYF